MLGDTAVAVHPEDERYRHLIGRDVRLPLAERLIPDHRATTTSIRAFGSGCVKITPAHDFNDYEIGQRHELRADQHLDASTRSSTRTCRRAYRGLDRYRRAQAHRRRARRAGAPGAHRQAQAHGAARRPQRRGARAAAHRPVVREHRAAGRAGHRGGANRAASASCRRTGRSTYFEWMRNIQRLVHQPPAVVGPPHSGLVRRRGQRVRRRASEAEARAAPRHRPHGRADAQDDDVLDTWFSSALWPFSTQGWPEQTPDLQAYYPTNVLVTGFDIIFFWVARMMMMGLQVHGRRAVPRGLRARADPRRDGEKMSKSKGNVIDPLDIVDGIELETLLAKRTSGLMQPQLTPAIEKATRRQFPDGIAAMAPTRCASPSPRWPPRAATSASTWRGVEGYRNFCNKLWNAARFVLMIVEAPGPARPRQPTEPRSPIAGSARALGRMLERSPGRIHGLPLRLRGARRCTSSPGTSSATGTWSSPSRCCSRTSDLRRRSAAPRRTLAGDPGGAAARAAPVHAVHHRGDLAEVRPAGRPRRSLVMLAPYPAAAGYARGR